MGALYLGLDVGTQGTKGLLVDAGSRQVVARAARAYGLIEGLPPGHAEQHPETWIQAVAAVARELWSTRGVDATALRGIGVSGQQHGLVVLDGRGEVVRPAKLWCDTSTAGEARELSRALGRAVPAGFTASKVLWLARREPASWERACWALLPHDYVNFRLSGRMVMEAGDASGTGFFDVERRAFDPRAMAAIDARLAEKLPPLVEAGEPAGRLSPEGAELLGLPRDGADAVVSAGGGDNMMSAIGSGATAPGVVVLSLGTSGTAFTYSPRPVIDPEGLIAPFCDSTGGWLPLLCVMNATGVLEEVRAAFGGDHEGLTREAERAPAGAEGLLFLPFLQGERVPDLPDATGSLLGLRPGRLRRELVYRAAIEGVSLNLAWGVERMRKLGIAVDSVRLVGGGARNALWRQILADCLGARLELCAEAESGALGAAIQASWTDRRARGERVTAHEAAEGFVRTEESPASPRAENGRLYATLLGRFVEEVGRHGPS